MSNGSDDLRTLRWQWDDARDGDERVGIDVLGGGSVRFEQWSGGGFAIRALDASGKTVWTHPIPEGIADAASFATDERAVYAGLYRAQVTGARVVALEVATGRLIWDVPLLGLGPLHHSKYRNRLQLRLVGDWLVAFGEESAGRYVEARDLLDGTLVARRVERS